jgi:hypothetical protein
MQFTGEEERAGRWADMARWECGIHPADEDPPTLVELKGAP